jgi:hypothetical protein
LTVEQAAFHLHEGLWDPDDATQKKIEDALKKAIASGELPIVRGAPMKTAWRERPIIVNAYEVANWAERAGLELESNGSWNDYILEEHALQDALDDRFRTLRAMQAAKENQKAEASADSVTDSPILNDICSVLPSDPERLRDQAIALLHENFRLRDIQDVPNGKASVTRDNTLPNIIGAMLALFLDTDEGGKKLSAFESQNAIITALLDRYSHKPGISESNLKKQFAAAKKSLEQS